MFDEALRTSGSYDQLNLGDATARKKVARRVLVITETYSNPQKPNWDTSKFFSGMGGAGDPASPELRQHGFKKAKDAFDVEDRRACGRDMRRAEQGDGTTVVSTSGDDNAKGPRSP